MSQKNFLYILTTILLFSFLTIFEPVPAQAEGITVVDWIKDEKPEVEETKESTVPAVTEDKSLIVIIGKLILYTILILVMIYGLIKFLAIRQKKLQPNQTIKLMGGTPLGNNKSLQLVKVGTQLYMIGVGDQVTLIKEFTDAEEINNIEKDLDNQPTLLSNPVTSFVKQKVIRPEKNEVLTKTTSNPEIDAQRGFEQLFSQSLKKQKSKQEQFAMDLSKDEEKEGHSS